MQTNSKIPRFLVVDASILFSSFNKDSIRRHLIEELPNYGYRLVSPDFALEELLQDKERIMKFARINKLEFMYLFSLLERKIETYPKMEYDNFLLKAGRISPHGKNVHKDDPYFSLALVLNSAIWSDEKAFKKQDIIKIFSTSELIGLLYK